MIILASRKSLAHDPDSFFRRGKTIPHPEQAERFTLLHRAVMQAGHAVVEPEGFGQEILTGVHDPGYVAFLATESSIVAATS